MLENGNILVYDNGTHRPYTMQNLSRVLEINPESGEIVWEYKDHTALHFHSSFISGAQRLPNGNTLICEGCFGRFFEVTPEKEIVWEYVSPFSGGENAAVLGPNNAVFRAYRYSPDFPGLKGRNLDPRRVRLTLQEMPFWKERIELEEKKKKESEAKTAGKKNAFADRLKAGRCFIVFILKQLPALL